MFNCAAIKNWVCEQNSNCIVASVRNIGTKFTTGGGTTPTKLSSKSSDVGMIKVEKLSSAQPAGCWEQLTQSSSAKNADENMHQPSTMICISNELKPDWWACRCWMQIMVILIEMMMRVYIQIQIQDGVKHVQNINLSILDSVKVNLLPYCFHEVKLPQCGSFRLKNRSNFHWSRHTAGAHTLL